MRTNHLKYRGKLTYKRLLVDMNAAKRARSPSLGSEGDRLRPRLGSNRITAYSAVELFENHMYSEP